MFFAEISGSAVADICVGVDGRVSEVRVLQATTGMGDAVHKAALTWRYQPFTQQGRPIAVCFQMKFHFTWKN